VSQKALKLSCLKKLNVAEIAKELSQNKRNQRRRAPPVQMQ
jgi:hypothetical protein